MPANKEALIRYRIIDGALRDKQKPYPTLGEIVQLCESVLGTSFSESTIQKDIYSLRFDAALNYNAPIEFSKAHRGYRYTDPNYTISSIALSGDEINAIELAAGILEQFKGTQLYADFDNAVEKILQTLSIRKILKSEQVEKIIQVEKVSYFKGIESLATLIDFIRKSQAITFEYQSFERETPLMHTISPYLLKEYRNRWYLVGLHSHYKQIRTFGIDRMSNIKASKEKFEVLNGFDPVTFFKYAFGISILSNKPEDVVLSFTPFQGKYIKSQSLHHTQEILADNKKELKVKIRVLVSYELQMQILSYGDQVKVLKPASLVKEIKEMHCRALKQYK
ncbi:MAG: helix-turn-helix transcriptional regulator [Bacteroidia bacterium]